jgi:hypothetical protein
MTVIDDVDTVSEEGPLLFTCRVLPVFTLTCTLYVVELVVAGESKK